MHRKYDPSYREPVVLRDGTHAVLRLIRADDSALLAAGFAQLSAESRYRRFLCVKNALSPEEIRYFTTLDNEDHVAIVAVTTDDQGHEHGLGVARFIRLQHAPDTADVAVTVIDRVQHKGLGLLLVQHLIEAARERGLRRLHFDMLASNDPMRALLREIAPDFHPRIQSGMATVEIPLYPDQDEPRVVARTNDLE